MPAELRQATGAVLLADDRARMSVPGDVLTERALDLAVDVGDRRPIGFGSGREVSGVGARQSDLRCEIGQLRRQAEVFAHTLSLVGGSRNCLRRIAGVRCQTLTATASPTRLGAARG